MPESIMLEVQNLYSGYNGIDVVKDINLEVKRSEILAVIGPNGCGKTTLLKTLARLLPCRGKILFEQTEISAIPRKSLAKKIALLSQNGGIYFPYTVYDTAALGRYSHTSSMLKNLTADDRQIIRTVLAKLNLWECRDSLISELSGGQLQRVFLARTLVQDPDLILLDEPTNHLDLKNQIELLEYLSVWTKESNRAVIAVLHDLNLCRRFADKAALMDSGVMVSYGACETVLSDSRLTKVYGLDIRSFMLESLEKWRD
ncbi:MAG: ABC transporter ATP-binding protein [Treponema sp.]|nr:ABC transporter ATP-binding protein [Treponema sp.]